MSLQPDEVKKLEDDLEGLGGLVKKLSLEAFAQAESAQSPAPASTETKEKKGLFRLGSKKGEQNFSIFKEENRSLVTVLDRE